MGKGGNKSGGSQTTTVQAPSYMQPYIKDLAAQVQNIGTGQNPMYTTLQGQLKDLDAQIKQYSTPARSPALQAQNAKILEQLLAQRGQLTNQLSQTEMMDSNAGKLFEGSYTVDPSQTSQDALAQLEALARGGDGGLTNNALGYVNDVVSGNYLNGNPYIDAVAERAGRSLQNQYRDAVTGVGMDAAGAGRYGSGLYQKAVGDKQDALGQSLADLNNSIYYNNYNDERTRQQAMAALAPELAQSRYNDANMLASIGATTDNLAQQRRDEEIMRFEYARDYPQNQLDQAINRIMALSGSGGSTTQTSTGGRGTGGLGSALSGAVGGGLIGTQLAGGLTSGAAGLAAIPGLGWAGAGLGLLGGLLG